MAVQKSDSVSSTLNVGLDSENDESRTLPAEYRRRTLSIPREFDIFGFYLSLKHTLIVLLLIILMFGPVGAVVFLLALGLYAAFQKNSKQITRQSRTKLTRWTGGANIKGMKDLPPDPRKSG